MGIVFGRTGVAEPKYSVLLSRSSVPFPYEIRSYGRRYAIEAAYHGEDLNPAFRLLAGYIGVGRSPQNEGSNAIAMTAPVVTDANSPKKGETISMTAPVVTKQEENRGQGSEGGAGEVKKMQFVLPEQYDEMSKIPKPSNPKVTVVEVPPAYGAVHRFDGWVKEKRAKEKVAGLVNQLKQDGLTIDERDALQKYLLWQYNPPFTIPNFRRNEVWVELTKDQADEHVKRFPAGQDAS